MAQQFFIKRGKKINGPFTVEKFQALKKEKKIKADDEISQSAEGPWESLDSYEKSKQSDQDFDKFEEEGSRTHSAGEVVDKTIDAFNTNLNRVREHITERIKNKEGNRNFPG